MTPTDGRRLRRIPNWLIATGAGVVALALLVGIVIMSTGQGRPRGRAVAVPPPQSAPVVEPPPDVSAWPRWGVTHTEFSGDAEREEVVETASHLLARVPLVQNQHIMGWGADNPEPVRGKYDFRNLDRRVRFMARSQALPVITLCCAPDWMKGGADGHTDWNALEAPPNRENFDDFAKLAATVARRYPTVEHFMVWNEFKGFWNSATNRWDAEAYTELYNKVYTALKKVNGNIKVGGPYIPIVSDKNGRASELQGAWGVVDQRDLDAVEYWMRNKKGADFIVVDGASMTRDAGAYPDDFAALAKFGAVTTWLKQKSGGLPVWWAEWYVAPDNADWTEERRTAVQTVAMMEFATSGATTALYWNPQRKPGEDCPGCLWRPGTGEELPMAGVLSGFTKWFPEGVPLVPLTSDNPAVRVLAQERQLVMVNTTDAAVTTTIDGRQFDLRPYEVRWSGRGGA
ncbi:xylan 1,4-beta-xylosidase [Streptosporangium algeriense]|uniref:Xylan 1,4-beta-xylosidase n=1 Tax=Streptosporangium algeriense TaxID=1682748 RepID=A0ABW3DMC3_9ACTN